MLSKLRRISQALTELHLRDLLPTEKTQLEARVLAEVTSLWFTNRTRTAVITVQDEVKTELYYLDTTIWDTIPTVYRSMAKALAEHYPTLKMPKRFLTFGSWIGGDRDGNPNVTAEITVDSLRLHRGLAFNKHRVTTTPAQSLPDRVRHQNGHLHPGFESAGGGAGQIRTSAIFAGPLSKRTLPHLGRRTG